MEEKDLEIIKNYINELNLMADKYSNKNTREETRIVHKIETTIRCIENNLISK